MLVLGADALTGFRRQLDSLRADTDAWEDTTTSTRVDDDR